jgi:thiol-disulfide isomerase/thioredoxin
MTRNMYSLFHRLVVLAAVVSITLPAHAALKVGDPAPKLQVAQWVQGDPVTGFEGDKVYIVEFWATWCGPCISAIPHLNEIYMRHKDKGLVVIGQNVSENNVKAVPGFVKKMGAKMTYRVALDDPSVEGGFMAAKWLRAAGQNGIPCAFVVDKSGKIAYIGHPMKLEESMLATLLAAPSTKPAEPAGGTADGPAAPSAKAGQLVERAVALIRAGKLDEAETTVTELHEELDPKFQYIGGLMEMNLLLARKQEADAIGLSKILCEDFASRPEVLNAVAGMLVSGPNASPVLQAAAEKIATPISASEGPSRSAAHATLARIAHLRGDKARAVELQTLAVSSAAPEDAAAAKTLLEEYQRDARP